MTDYSAYEAVKQHMVGAHSNYQADSFYSRSCTAAACLKSQMFPLKVVDSSCPQGMLNNITRLAAGSNA